MGSWLVKGEMVEGGEGVGGDGEEVPAPLPPPPGLQREVREGRGPLPPLQEALGRLGKQTLGISPLLNSTPNYFYL